jgi:hypothetical protein
MGQGESTCTAPPGSGARPRQQVAPVGDPLELRHELHAALVRLRDLHVNRRLKVAARNV